MAQEITKATIPVATIALLEIQRISWSPDSTFRTNSKTSCLVATHTDRSIAVGLQTPVTTMTAAGRRAPSVATAATMLAADRPDKRRNRDTGCGSRSGRSEAGTSDEPPARSAVAACRRLIASRSYPILAWVDEEMDIEQANREEADQHQNSQRRRVAKLETGDCPPVEEGRKDVGPVDGSAPPS